MNVISQEDSNEVDEILKDVEKKLKFESFIDKNLFQAEKFLKKDDWKIILNISYHFHQNIERVWPYFNTFENFKTNLKLDKILIKEIPKENKLGNLFEGTYNDNVYHAKILKMKNTIEFKKIEWIFYFENDEIFKIKLNLYKITYDNSSITYDNSSVIDLKISFVPKLGQYILDELIPEFNSKNLFQQIEEIIQKQYNAIFQYESCLLQASPEEIWNILSDNSKLVLVAPNNECFLPLNINKIKQGEIVVKMELFRKDIGNKWIFCYTILGGKPFDILKQSLFVQLTKINNNETQLGIFTKIYENIKSDMIVYLSNKKKYVLFSLKDYFMNFYTPNDVNNVI